MEQLSTLTKQYEMRKALADCADYIMCKGLRQSLPMHLERFTKAAVSGITTGDVAGVIEALQPFVDIITQRTVLGKLRGMTVDAPPYMPVPTIVEEPDVTWVGEGQPIPLAHMSISSERTLPTKYCSMWAAPKETIRIGDGRARNLLIRTSTRQLARGEDRKFLGDDAAGTDSPAGILNGVAASGSGSPTDLQDALEQLYSDVVDGRSETPVFVTSGRGAMFLAGTDLQAFKDAKLVGGNILGAPLLISPGAADALILIDANELAHTDSGLVVDQSGAAAIQMDDNPSSGATQLVSAFQVNAIVLRFTRYVHWVKLRDDAVGYIELPIGGSPS